MSQQSKTPSYKKIKSSKYCFHTDEASPRKYYFCLKDSEKPKPDKIGDGSFGIVYRVHDGVGVGTAKNPSEEEIPVPGAKEYALKIFYEIPGEIGKELEIRFEEELNYPIVIRDRNSQRPDGNRIPSLSGIIEPIGKITDLKSQDVFSGFLKKELDEEKISVSSRALLLPLYTCTLKDLLEGRRSFSQGGVNHNGEGINGYAALETCSHEKRVQYMYPFLKDIVKGLRTLYSAEFAHLDIKPANIFVKDEGDDFEVVLADMGMVNPKKKDEKHSVVKSALQDVSMLGTRHYRSPEQKDFFDICDAEVDESSNGMVKLIIRDRKFRDTIIEEGDFVVFDKSRNKKFRITNIDKENFEQDGITITINDPSKKIKSDPRTQIRFIKKQGVRTDLFGLGAIAFDILTCGESPEIFYDNIRGLDTTNNSVDKIMEKYRQVLGFNTTEPHLLHIFKSFKHNHKSAYAPENIVKFIIMCMMYRAEGSYFHPSSREFKVDLNYFSAEYGIIENVYKYLEEKFGSGREDFRKNNCIAHKVVPGGDYADTKSLRVKLNELQKTSSENLHERILRGLSYYKELIQTILKLVSEQAKGNKNFFVELMPENLELSYDDAGSPKLKFIYTAYDKKEEYSEDLLRDNVYTKIRQDKTHYFIPKEIAYVRRTIYLWREKTEGKDSLGENQEEKKSRNFSFRYEFNSSSFSGDNVGKDDWITLNYNKEQLLFQVKSVKGNIIYCEVEGESLNSGNPEGLINKLKGKVPSQDHIEAVYYRSINRYNYYLFILGTYLKQLFFVGIEGNSAEKPSHQMFVEYILKNKDLGKVDYRKIGDLVKEKKRLIDKEVEKLENNGRENKMGDIPLLKPSYSVELLAYTEFMLKLADQYVKMSIPGVEGSYFDHPNINQDNLEDFIGNIDAEFLSIRQFAEKELFGFNQGEFDRINLKISRGDSGNQKQELVKLRDMKTKINQIKSENLEELLSAQSLERLLKELLIVRIDKTPMETRVYSGEGSHTKSNDWLSKILRLFSSIN